MANLQVSSRWKKAALTVEPVGEMLYLIKIPEEGVIERDGKTIFNIEGVRHVVKQLQIALVLEIEEEDF